MIKILKSQLNLISANWEDIKYEISCSNVIQRDNVLFAKKLDKSLLVMAKEGDKEVVEVKVTSNESNILFSRPKVMKDCGQLVLGEQF